MATESSDMAVAPPAEACSAPAGGVMAPAADSFCRTLSIVLGAEREQSRPRAPTSPRCRPMTHLESSAVSSLRSRACISSMALMVSRACGAGEQMAQTGSERWCGWACRDRLQHATHLVGAVVVQEMVHVDKEQLHALHVLVALWERERER